MSVVILSHPFQLVGKDDKWGAGDVYKEKQRANL